MGRTRSLTTGVVATVAAIVVAGGGAFGVTQLMDDDTAAAGVVDGTPAPSPEPEVPEPTPEPSPTVTAEPSPTPTPTPTEEPTPEPTPEALLAAGDSGDEVRELQSRLAQIDWYAPDISGEYDDVTVTAVSGFQAKREIPDTGEVDQQTWDRLVEMTRTPTDDEMHNRLTPGPAILAAGDTGDQVRELQARLTQVQWFSGEITPTYGPQTTAAVTGFQAKREIPETGEVDQRTWDRLLAMTRTPTDDELHNREPEEDEDEATDEDEADEKDEEEKDEPKEDDDSAQEEEPDTAGLDPRCTTGRALCVDKSTNMLRWVVDGEVRTTLDVRFGSELTPTREGAFSVGWKSRDHVSSLYDTPMPYAMFFSGGQAVHYSPDFAANGYNGASHGCVNVRDEGAIAALFDSVDVGDKVIVYRS